MIAVDLHTAEVIPRIVSRSTATTRARVFLPTPTIFEPWERTPVSFSSELADWYSISRWMQRWHELDVATTRRVPAPFSVSWKFEDVTFTSPTLRSGRMSPSPSKKPAREISLIW